MRWDMKEILFERQRSQVQKDRQHYPRHIVERHMSGVVLEVEEGSFRVQAQDGAHQLHQVELKRTMQQSAAITFLIALQKKLLKFRCIALEIP